MTNRGANRGYSLGTGGAITNWDEFLAVVAKEEQSTERRRQRRVLTKWLDKQGGVDVILRRIGQCYGVNYEKTV